MPAGLKSIKPTNNGLRARPKIEWGLKPLQETIQVLRVK
jgi:hypothetical protein